MVRLNLSFRLSTSSTCWSRARLSLLTDPVFVTTVVKGIVIVGFRGANETGGLEEHVSDSAEYLSAH